MARLLAKTLDATTGPDAFPIEGAGPPAIDTRASASPMLATA